MATFVKSEGVWHLAKTITGSKRFKGGQFTAECGASGDIEERVDAQFMPVAGYSCTECERIMNPVQDTAVVSETVKEAPVVEKPKKSSKKKTEPKTEETE